MAKQIQEHDFFGKRDADGNITELTMRYYVTDTLPDGTVVYVSTKKGAEMETLRRKRVQQGDAVLSGPLGEAVNTADTVHFALRKTLDMVRRQIAQDEGVA